MFTSRRSDMQAVASIRSRALLATLLPTMIVTTRQRIASAPMSRTSPLFLDRARVTDSVQANMRQLHHTSFPGTAGRSAARGKPTLVTALLPSTDLVR